MSAAQASRRADVAKVSPSSPEVGLSYGPPKFPPPPPNRRSHAALRLRLPGISSLTAAHSTSSTQAQHMPPMRRMQLAVAGLPLTGKGAMPKCKEAMLVCLWTAGLCLPAHGAQKQLRRATRSGLGQTAQNEAVLSLVFWRFVECLERSRFTTRDFMQRLDCSVSLCIECCGSKTAHRIRMNQTQCCHSLESPTSSSRLCSCTTQCWESISLTSRHFVEYDGDGEAWSSLHLDLKALRRQGMAACMSTMVACMRSFDQLRLPAPHVSGVA